MPRIPILAKGQGPCGNNGERGRENSTLARPLPVFYMSDYSVLGLRVDPLEAALQALGEAGFSVVNEAGDLELVLDHAGYLEGIVQRLREKGVECEIGDVVGCVYQG